MTGEGSRTETLEGQDPMDQEQAQSDSIPLEHVFPSSSIVGEGSLSTFGIDLIPFMPTKGEEVPNFNTIFCLIYDATSLTQFGSLNLPI